MSDAPRIRYITMSGPTKVFEITASTLEKFNIAAQEMLHNYHPAAYATRIDEPRLVDGMYVARGSHWSSAD